MPVDGRGPDGQSAQQIGGQPGSPTIEELCDQIADDSPVRPVSVGAPSRIIACVDLLLVLRVCEPLRPFSRVLTWVCRAAVLGAQYRFKPTPAGLFNRQHQL